MRFPADDPAKVETFRAGISVRALALDSKENVWVVSNCSLDFPMPKVPDGASIMEQFKIMGEAMLKYPKSTGVAHMIRPDGTQLAPKGFTGGGAVDIPWGVNIDGNDDVWIGNFAPRNNGVVLMAGADPRGHPAGICPRSRGGSDDRREAHPNHDRKRRHKRRCRPAVREVASAVL